MRHLYNVYVVYMVKAMINISKETNKVLNVIKAKHDLKNKSEAIDHVAQEYAIKVLHHNLKPEHEETKRKIAF